MPKSRHSVLVGMERLTGQKGWSCSWNRKEERQTEEHLDDLTMMAISGNPVVGGWRWGGGVLMYSGAYLPSVRQGLGHSGVVRGLRKGNATWRSAPEI